MDNHQGLVSSLLLAKALVANSIVPPIDYGLLFVSDEETGNKYGMDFIVENHSDLFGKDDLFLIPDYGNSSSDIINVAEKSVLWLKVTVIGEQSHAAYPEKGKKFPYCISSVHSKGQNPLRRFQRYGCTVSFTTFDVRTDKKGS